MRSQGVSMTAARKRWARASREGLLWAHREFLSRSELAKCYAKAGDPIRARKFGVYARQAWAQVSQFIETGRIS